MSWGIMFSRYGQNATKQHRILFLMLLSTSGLCFADAAVAAYSSADYSSVVNASEQKIDDYRMKEVNQLQVVLSRSAPQDQDPDMVLRLAELYTEKYKLLFGKENEIWAAKMDAYLRQPLAQQKATRKPVLDNAISRQWLMKAVSTLERIPSLHSRYPRMDEVYYFLGFNQWELGHKKESIHNFENIVNHSGKSRYAAEAHRYIADYAFANRDFDVARDNYQAAAKSENSPSKPRVLYGLAWSEFKLRQYNKAVNTMGQAIMLARQDSSAEKAGIALQRDAVDSLSLFYSEGGDVNGASKYFADILGKNEAVDALRRLAGNYQHEGRYSQALLINKQLVDMGGSTTEVGEDQRFQIMMDSLHVAENKGDQLKVVALLKQITSDFVSNAKTPSEDRIEVIRSLVRKNALLAHQEGNKSKNSHAAFARSEELYRIYLGAFATKIKPEDSAEIHYLLADSLSQQGKHQAAAKEFRAIIDASFANPNDAFLKKYQKDSALGLIYSLDSYFKGKSAKSLPAAETDELIGAIDAYVRIYPTDKDAPKYLARAAGLLVTSNRMSEARPRLLNLANQYPSSKEALDAALTLVKDCEDRKDYAGTAVLAESILKNGPLLSQDRKGLLRAQLESLSSRAKFNQVQTLEKDQNFSSAAVQYERLAREAKENEVRYKALNNAAVSYSRAKDQQNELRIFQEILQIYPEDEQTQKNVLGLANEKFLHGQYEDAASIYEGFYSAFKKRITSLHSGTQKNVSEAIRGAALLRSALNQQDKASDDFREIVAEANAGITSARNTAEDFLFNTANKLMKSGNSIEAIRALQKYTAAFPNGKYAIESTLNTGLLYAKLQEDEKAQNYISTVMKKVRAKGRSSTGAELGFAAHARLLLLAPLEAEFENAPLRLPEAQLKLDINSKLAALDRLNKGYIEVIEFGDGNWGVESFRRMAMAYRNFAQKLEAAPVPTEFSPEDKAKFKAQLRNVAAPVYVKVNETLENALKKGESLTVTGAVMAKVYILAAVMAARPDRYPLVQEVNWSNASEWAMGEFPADSTELSKHRETLLKKPDALASWVAVGNWHLSQGQFELAKIFYLKTLDKNAKDVAAINNLAYLQGLDGNLSDASAGFKAAMNHDEFATQPKKNICRLYMASGLWRHANLAYRQLQVRMPNDPEVTKGLGLSYLAIGKLSLAQPLAETFTSGNSVNARYAKAVLELAQGGYQDAHAEIHALVGSSEFASLLDSNWNMKEGK